MWRMAIFAGVVRDIVPRGMRPGSAEAPFMQPVNSVNGLIPAFHIMAGHTQITRTVSALRKFPIDPYEGHGNLCTEAGSLCPIDCPVSDAGSLSSGSEKASEESYRNDTDDRPISLCRDSPPAYRLSKLNGLGARAHHTIATVPSWQLKQSFAAPVG